MITAPTHRLGIKHSVVSKALCKVQPGSAVDKSGMISFLVNLPVAKTVAEALSSL